jgi:hypothetical protein
LFRITPASTNPNYAAEQRTFRPEIRHMPHTGRQNNGLLQEGLGRLAIHAAKSHVALRSGIAKCPPRGRSKDVLKPVALERWERGVISRVASFTLGSFLEFSLFQGDEAKIPEWPKGHSLRPLV